MKVVVTGGTGFLGLRLARAILERGTLYGASAAPEPIDKMILFDVVTPPERPQGLDERVEIVDRQLEDYGFLKLHSFYVRYRLPMMIEVQCYEWAEGVGPDSQPES